MNLLPRTAVVNLHKSPYDVYIGRAGHGQDGYFGNPFVLDNTTTRDKVLAQYDQWFHDRLDSDQEFRDRICALKGKVLGCFCKPQACHGDIIADYLNNEVFGCHWERIALPNADVRLCKTFLPTSEALALYYYLHAAVPWQQDQITYYGKEYDIPRLHQWYGDAGMSYTWSGIVMHPKPWLDQLIAVRSAIEAQEVGTFNTVLLNLYRDGEDTVSWHSDDEPELGNRPTIASVSLGAERDFLLRTKDHKTRITIPLPAGSLLLMAGDTQKYWEHSLPRRKGVTEPRINLTFRQIEDLNA